MNKVLSALIGLLCGIIFGIFMGTIFGSASTKSSEWEQTQHTQQIFFSIIGGIVGLIIGVMVANEEEIKNDDELNDNSDTRIETLKKGENMQVISIEYHLLLQTFFKKIKLYCEKLSEDEAFIEIILPDLSNTPIDKFIKNCFLWDSCQLLKILVKDKGKLGIENSELNGLLCLADDNFLDKEYSQIESMFQAEIYNEVKEHLIVFSDIPNPIDIQINSKNASSDIYLKKVDSEFSLLTALKILEHEQFEKYAGLLYQFLAISVKSDNVITKDEEEKLKQIYQLVHNPIPEKINEHIKIIEQSKNESLEKSLEELDSLIGLTEVKKEVRTLINFIKIQKEREKSGLKSTQVSYHCVFTGPPGTGKTTVARIVANIFKQLGIVKQGHLVETDRSGLIAEYSGQTAVKVNKVVTTALNGILFIDEAYSLVGENKDDFGNEAVATLIKRIEDDRDKLVVILAGYTDKIKKFIETNPGFKSRFNRYVEFSDYPPEDLYEIFILNCNKLEYNLVDKAKIELKKILKKVYSERDLTFGNARFVRNLFEKTLEMQANRIAHLDRFEKETLTTILSEDIPKGVD